MTQSAATDAATPLEIAWQEPRGMYMLALKNALLTMLTLGIYYFWGKVEVRRRIWHAIRINGEPLEYTGTGKELFLGFVIVFLLLFAGLIAYGVLLAIMGANPDNPLLVIPMYAFLFWLMGVAIYRARRYRLRRTQWRGIRGTMAGSPARFANLWFGSAILAGLTLGWAIPWRQVLLYRVLTNDTRIGTTHLRFADAATAGPLYVPFAMMWFSGIMTALLVFGAAIIGAALAMKTGTANAAGVWVFAGFGAALGVIAVIMTLRYHAIKLNYLARQTYLHDGHFKLEFAASDLFRLILGNVLIMVFSLGILLPIVQVRLARHFVQKLSFVGTVDLAAIAQATDEMEKTGEGLAEAFDIDAF